MLRTFSEHRVRRVESLNGRWTFTPADDSLADRYDSIQVPSAWESLPGLEAYRGKAKYKRIVWCPESTHLRLVFGGVSHTADVYFDGEKTAHHYDAFTPFEVFLPAVKAGAHDIAVMVDNSFGDHSCLHIDNDYYTYGGITRPVELHHVPDVFIERLDAVPVRKKDSWGLNVAVKLRNLSDREQRRGFRLSIAGASYEVDALAVEANGKIKASLALEGIQAGGWSAENPELHLLTIELLDGETVVDDKIDRIGFREVSVEGRELVLNGEPIRLRGYNRHEDYAQYGCAIPLEAMARDLAIMRDLGCNFVRTCHYPNDMRFLDLCDEMGFYVWEESHARTVNVYHEKFREQIGGSTREMISWHRNHPAILMWGCLNECDAHKEEGVPEYAFVIDLIRSLDNTRPVTYASNHGKKDLCFHMADIISVNWYVGWYGQSIDQIGPHLEDFLAWLHSDESRGGAEKPLIISEFGAGGIYGNRQANRSHWSEEYQCDVLDESLKVYLNHPDVAGAAIWQFCDCRVTEGHWHGRPRTINNKGTVDEYRRPKLAYETVKKRMLEASEK